MSQGAGLSALAHETPPQVMSLQYSSRADVVHAHVPACAKLHRNAPKQYGNHWKINNDGKPFREKKTMFRHIQITMRQ